MAEKTYEPTEGMKIAARRALKWKEEGKANGAGTAVGWGRATDIVSGNAMSLSVVKRMYSFFSRHEVDKKGEDFNNTSNPSNGRIMWDAWGGDAGFTWSRKIVEMNKSIFEGVFFKSNDLGEIDTYIDKLEPNVNEEPTLQKKSVWSGAFDPATPNTTEEILEEILIETLDEKLSD
jgi:hypothetical protein